VRKDRNRCREWVPVAFTIFLVSAACGEDEPSACQAGCDTVQELCGVEARGCVDRCKAARLDDTASTDAGLACIAGATTCDELDSSCGVALDGDFRKSGGSGATGSGGTAASGSGGTGTDSVCEDTCVDAADGVCDDGGPAAAYALCQLGTDCTDCGVRSALLCTNGCDYARDGECDDGLSGATSAACIVGTDCQDCGPRSLGGPAGCQNTCRSAFDGRCDDGGPGSDIKFCDLGTDCADCGAR
jgi:hypothetical protein